MIIEIPLNASRPRLLPITRPVPVLPPEGKARDDLRDRLAFVAIHGGLPSHLRGETNREILAACIYGRTVTPARVSGSFRVHPEVMQTLDLIAHPMVAKVLEHVRWGGVVVPAKRIMLKARQPYSRTLMKMPDGRNITIKIDGSRLDHWVLR